MARALLPLAATLDAELRGKLGVALASWGIAAPLSGVPTSLGVGEAWLLLHAGARDGHVARIVARETRVDEVLGPSARTRLADSALAAPMRALVGVAARACRELPRELRGGVSLEIASARTTSLAMTGRSFQLSAAVALLSRALRRPPLATCAGSACVGVDGALSPVEHLAEKLSALSRDFPDVRTVVVAELQSVPEMGALGPIKLVRAATLDRALASFGLDVRELPPSLLDRHVERASSFEHRNKESRAPREWSALSLDAWESCLALADAEPEESARCRAWAALFAVHAGDPHHASALADGVDARVIEALPGLAAWMHVVRATANIDRSALDEARADAEQALRESAALTAAEQAKIRGRALGTYGRALLHMGLLEDAERSLREAAEHHRVHVPRELAQSLTHLATCLRRRGRFDDALAAVDDALAVVVPQRAVWAAAQTTEAYLRLERGRVLLEMARHDDAERELLLVSPRDEVATYPRLGAERSLVRLRIATGHTAAAHAAFLHCLEGARVLLAGGQARTIAQVAAVGLAQAMTGLRLEGDERAEAASLWTKAFDRPATAEDFRAVLGAWIF